jgi:hypothetical protein
MADKSLAGVCVSFIVQKVIVMFSDHCKGKKGTEEDERGHCFNAFIMDENIALYPETCFTRESIMSLDNVMRLPRITSMGLIKVDNVTSIFEEFLLLHLSGCSVSVRKRGAMA